MIHIPFNKVYSAPNELKYLTQWSKEKSNNIGKKFSKHCKEALEKHLKTSSIHITSSCTASLETAFLLLDLKSGDEVIMPSFTFSSTANSVCLRGATPVFIDIKPNTLNIDEALITKAINKNTKAIVVVHYAGIACNMNAILKIANDYGLKLIEDSAQTLGSKYFGKPLGTLSDFGAISFHHTKNIHCGEGGGLVIKNSEDFKLAEKIIDKGTNRKDFIQGTIDKYNWMTLGSSFVISDIQLSLLASQLEVLDHVTAKRVAIWNQYHKLLENLEFDGWLQRPKIEEGALINGHIYYILLQDKQKREKVVRKLLNYGIKALSHYEPLHLSAAGKRYGRTSGVLNVTENTSERLLRLPIWADMSFKAVRQVVHCLSLCLHEIEQKLMPVNIAAR